MFFQISFILEITAAGLTNIAYMEERRTQCGGYVTYILFNYLPNLVGVDILFLERTSLLLSPNSYHEAVDKWMVAGNFGENIYDVMRNVI